MKSSLGKTLREIRVGKQVSICSLADQHLSKSQISRFERGESEISCANLINILDKLNANFPEFYNSMSKKPTITAFFEV
ncbi:helix-turn-helix domain-containing protein [Lactobacillus delbrueckii]|uniref:helix-turn-helix domain-containing protein n=1 Tax=Lactobacillus delbrueckii TaxID=1584 RepID=UPI003A885EC0